MITKNLKALVLEEGKSWVRSMRKILTYPVFEREAEIVKWALDRAPVKHVCPYLRQIVLRNGGRPEAVYCEANRQKRVANGGSLEEENMQASPVWQSRVDCASLQLFCADQEEPRYEKCIYFPRSEKA